MTLAIRCKGDDVAGIVKNQRINPLDQMVLEEMKIIKLFDKKSRPSSLLVWTASSQPKQM